MSFGNIKHIGGIVAISATIALLIGCNVDALSTPYQQQLAVVTEGEVPPESPNLDITAENVGDYTEEVIIKECGEKYGDADSAAAKDGAKELCIKNAKDKFSALTTTEEATGESCQISGIGWMICPLTRATSSFISAMYEFMELGLRVQKLETVNAGSESPLFTAWQKSLAFTLALFVVVTIIIIIGSISGNIFGK